MSVFGGLPEIFTGTFGEPDAPASYLPGEGASVTIVGIYREHSEVEFDSAGTPGMRTRVPTFDCAEADLPTTAEPGEHSGDVLEIPGFVERANSSSELRPEIGTVMRRFAVRGSQPSGVTGMTRLSLEELEN